MTQDYLCVCVWGGVHGVMQLIVILCVCVCLQAWVSGHCNNEGRVSPAISIRKSFSASTIVLDAESQKREGRRQKGAGPIESLGGRRLCFCLRWHFHLSPVHTRPFFTCALLSEFIDDVFLLCQSVENLMNQKQGRRKADFFFF